MSVITCPECSYLKLEQMPVNACLITYKCTHCEAMLNPKAGDCCVFCSYGTNRCPSKQIESYASH